MGVRKEKRATAKRTVGAGLHLGAVELQSDGAYVVRLTGGARVTARLDPEIPSSFIDECMRLGKRVLLADDERGATIVGALERPAGPAEETQVLHAKKLRLSADEEMTLEIGDLRIRLDRTGVARIKGRQVVIDAASLVRILAARVELP